jgi:hypothetical protein
MSWHHSDLYLFLCLLTGLAAFLAIIYECIHRRKNRIESLPADGKSFPADVKPGQGDGPEYLKKAKPLDGLQRDRPAERFSRLCESIEDLPPKEEASRVRDYFGILGGARPAEGRDRKGQRLAAYTPTLNKLRNRFRRRLTPGEVQRLEQRSHTRL